MMKKAELIFVPMAGMGHLVPLLEVAKHLVDLNSNIFISFIVIEGLPAELQSIVANTISLSTRIKFIYIPRPQPQPQPEYHKIDLDAPQLKLVAGFVQYQIPRIKDAVTNIVRDSSSVPDSPRLAGLVLDLLFTPLIDLANELGVPSYVFDTSCVAHLGFQFYIKDLLDDQKNVNFTELKDSDIEFNIPSYINPVSSKLFPSDMFHPESLNLEHDMLTKARKAKGILVNTFSELESHALHSISDGKQQPVYPVGPMLNLESSRKVVDQNCADIMEWLDEQPPSSIVFLCFGSMGTFDEDQVKEIAYALEHSGHRFLWSLRQPPVNALYPTNYKNVADVLPEGFLDRTAKIGKIIGWAPQVAILGHPAIGGFVSHCGWNSTLESIWFGVPIATWPLFGEQQLNAFKIVKELGIGVEIKMDYRKEIWREGIEIVSAEKIERGIRCLMQQDSDVRKRVKELSEKSRKALMDGGSSHSMLCRFIKDVMDNMEQKITFR